MSTDTSALEPAGVAVLGLSLVQQVFPKDPMPQTAWLSSLAQCTGLWLIYFPPAYGSRAQPVPCGAVLE